MSITLRLPILFLVCWLVSCVSTTQQTELQISQSTRFRTRYKMRPRRSYHCTYKYGRWRPYGLTLRTKVTSPPFVRILPHRRLRAFIRLSPQGPSKGAFVQVSRSGVTLWGTTAKPVGVKVYVNRPTMFGQTVIAGRNARLKWRGFRGRRASLELLTGSTYRSPSPLRADVPCEHTSILSRRSRDLRVATELPPSTKKVWLRKKLRIPVSATPGGKAEGSLFFRYTRRKVEFIKEQGGFVQIYLTMYSYAIFGWIPKTALAPPPQSKSGGLLGLLGRGGGGSARTRYVKRYTCSIKSSLFVQHKTNITKVGQLQQRTPFEVVEKGPTWTRIRFHFWQKWAIPTKEHHWVVPTPLLSNCHLLGARKAHHKLHRLHLLLVKKKRTVVGANFAKNMPAHKGRVAVEQPRSLQKRGYCANLSKPKAWR